MTSAADFRRRHYPQASEAEWADWRWQLRHRIHDLPGLERLLELTDDERAAIQRRLDAPGGMLPLGLTPYYAQLLHPTDPTDPLRRTMVPALDEFEVSADECDDPLGEDAHSPMPGLVHTYPDKVLLLATDFCAAYCRYCTRARMVGGGEFLPDRSMWQRALDYIAERPEIRDVLISGGDPLILSDERLEWLLSRLHAIPHIEFIRIGTKVPAVLPQRITPAFCQMLKRYHPVFFSIHFIHPDELTPEVAVACNRLADHGIVSGGQTVLLKGVNDDPDIMKALNLGLLKIRVRPYYLHQCDPIKGSMHFRTPVQAGLDILRSLTGHTTGYAVPQFMIDAPGGGGKIPISPNYVKGKEGDTLLLENFRGQIYKYDDAGGEGE